MKNRIWIASLAALTFGIPAIASADIVKVSTNQPVKVVKVDGPDRDKRADVIVVSHNDRNDNRYDNRNDGRYDNRNDNRYDNRNDGRFDNRNDGRYDNNYNGYNSNSRHGRITSTSIISTPRKNIRNGCGWGRAYFRYADGHKVKDDAFMCVTRNGQWRVVNR